MTVRIHECYLFMKHAKRVFVFWPLMLVKNSGGRTDVSVELSDLGEEVESESIFLMCGKSCGD